MTGNVGKTRVLFIDDDQSFLDVIYQAFGELGKDVWEIYVAIGADRALELLRRQPMDLAVLDLHMPDVDGLQLLDTLNRDFPGLQKAFLTGQADGHSRSAGLESGAALFLEKPASLDGMESLFATLNELAQWQRKQGGRGVLRRVGLLDIVKMECQSGNSRLFEVVAGGVTGQIYIQEGSIVHALTEGRRGQSAFTYLVCLPNAEFRLKQFVTPIERSIERQWEFLVLEAARLQEQTQAVSGAKAGPAAGRPLKMPPPTPVRLVSPAPITAPPPASFLPEPDASDFRVEEMLVCSEQREVLHEWQCRETEKRLEFLEFVLNQSRQLSQKLPLGGFDRLELQSSTGRMVAHWRGACGVLVRSNTSAGPATAADAALSQPIGQWLGRQTPVRGVLACGGVQSGKNTFNQPCSPDFSPAVLDGVWRCVDDMFETAHRHHFPAWQLRWIYERAQLHCVRRADGAFLGVFLDKNPQAVDLAGVKNLFNGFKSLRLPG